MVRSVRRAIFSLLVVLPIAISGIAGDLRAAEFSVRPALTLSEEYNDNILLDPVTPREEYTTRVIPAIGLHYQTPLWIWDGDYALDYRHFERGTVKDDTANTLNLRNRTRIVDDLVFVDISDVMSRVSLDVARDFTQESLVVNQAEQNIFTVSPTLVLKPTTNTALALGYQYQNTRYSNVPAGANAINRFDNSTYAEAAWYLSSRTTVTAGARDTRDQNGVENYEQIDVYAGPRYFYAENSSVYFLAGQRWFDYQGGSKADHPYWSAGITHRLSSITASLEGGVLYVQDPQRVLTRQDQYRAGVQKETARTRLAISGELNDYKDAKNNQLTSTSRLAQGAITYRLTQRTTGAGDASYQVLEDKTSGTITRINLSVLRIEHVLAEKFTMALEYRHLDSSSPQAVAGNYTSNRAIVELKKVF